MVGCGVVMERVRRGGGDDGELRHGHVRLLLVLRGRAHLQLLHQLAQLARLAHLVLLDDGVQVVRQVLFGFQLLLQFDLRLHKLFLSAVVSSPEESKKNSLLS